MERLTERNVLGTNVACDNCPKKGNCNEPYTCLNVVTDRLAAYEDAEEQGLLVRLPCKVGDILYVTDEGTTLPAVRLVENVTWRNGNVSIECVNQRTGTPYYCTAEDFGKTVFLTREEAEAALKEEAQ